MKVKNFIITAGMLCFLSSLAADTQINYTTTNLQLFPKVAHPDGGGFLFAWVSNEDPDFEIYTRAFDSNLSNPSPSTDEDCISKPSPADGHRLHAEIVPSIDPATNDKGAMAAWVNYNDQKVYTMRVTSTGFADWNDPVDVHPATDMIPPEMCSDGAGGAIFTWIERHYNSVTKVYTDSLWIKKITSSGATDWSKTLIGSTPGSIYMPRICADDNNGARVACVYSNIFDKKFTNDIIVSAVLKGYNKLQTNPFVGF
jgi:hypothetical protein